MIVHELEIPGCFLIEPILRKDARGYFAETYNQQDFKRLTGVDTTFVQDNESFSSRGVLRGLHYQSGEFTQAKLVRVVHGEVFDVAVDIRPGSATYGRYVSAILSGDNHKQLFIPKGFAHGFLVLSDTALFAYKCDDFYSKEHEAGIAYNDPDLNINWPEMEEYLISDRDRLQPTLKNSRPVW